MSGATVSQFGAGGGPTVSSAFSRNGQLGLAAAAVGASVEAWLGLDWFGWWVHVSSGHQWSLGSGAEEYKIV